MSLRAQDLRWQSGGARWVRIRMLMITDDEVQGRRLYKRRNTIVVKTPLELIVHLESAQHMMSTIVLGGRFAFDSDLEKALRDLYPHLGIVRLETEAN